MALKEHSLRLKNVLKSLDVPDSTIVKQTGISTSTISHLMTEVQDASINTIIAVLKAYPEINANYILTGIGDIFLTSIENNDGNDASTINRENQDRIVMLQKELKEAYAEIGRLSMELNKKVQRS